LFNLNKPLDADASPSAVNLLDEIEPVVNTSSLSFRGSSGATTERKNSMQSYIEEQFGELDGNLKEEEQWVSELRDVVELKRGKLILHGVGLLSERYCMRVPEQCVECFTA
jgi:hypothetical protein